MRRILLLAVLALSLSQAHAQLAPAPPAATPAPAPAAPAKVVNAVIFSDFACPYSAELFTNLEKFQQAHPQLLSITWKQTPLNIHPGSPLAHKAALAAGRQGKYDAMAELLFANQNHQDLTSLLAYARQLHLDLPRFRRDLDSPAVAAELAASLQEADAFGINQTPVLYIQGKQLTGVQSDETLLAAINGTVGQITPVPLQQQAPLDAKLIADLQDAPATAVKGDANAPLTIVEFTDFQCPFCRSAVAPMEEFVAARGKDVRWIVRSFPLSFHEDSELANEAALAAGEQGKFWEMHDLIFSHQNAIKDPDLHIYAESLHLDMKMFNDALLTHRFAGQIAADRALGTRAGVDGTPTFFVDGEPLTGARSLPELNQMADAHLTPGYIKAPAATPTVVAVTPDALDRRILGPSSDVPLTLTWYVDVRSPLAASQAELVHQLNTKYDGRVRVLFHAFPVASHPDGQLAGAALIAALAQNKFWPMFDALAQRRDLLDRDKLVSIAGGIGLDRDAFLNALEAASTGVEADRSEATRRGIQGAPVLFLNKQRVDGLQRVQFYTDILDKELQTPLQASTTDAAPASATR